MCRALGARAGAAFSAADVHQTARAVTGYGLGLLGIVAIKVLAPAYFARSDTRTPVRFALLVLALTQLLNLALVPWLGAAGLAASIGLGALVNAGLLLRGLLRLGVYRPAPGWPGFALRVTLADVTASTRVQSQLRITILEAFRTAGIYATVSPLPPTVMQPLSTQPPAPLPIPPAATQQKV